VTQNTPTGPRGRRRPSVGRPGVARRAGGKAMSPRSPKAARRAPGSADCSTDLKGLQGGARRASLCHGLSPGTPQPSSGPAQGLLRERGPAWEPNPALTREPLPFFEGETMIPRRSKEIRRPTSAGPPLAQGEGRGKGGGQPYVGRKRGPPAPEGWGRFARSSTNERRVTEQPQAKSSPTQTRPRGRDPPRGRALPEKGSSRLLRTMGFAPGRLSLAASTRARGRVREHGRC